MGSWLVQDRLLWKLEWRGKDGGEGEKKNKQLGWEIKKISPLFVLVLIYEAVLEVIAPMQGNTLRRFRGFLFFYIPGAPLIYVTNFPFLPDPRVPTRLLRSFPLFELNIILCQQYIPSSCQSLRVPPLLCYSKKKNDDHFK